MKRTIVLTSRQSRTITLTHEGGRITEIVNESGIPFPYVVGQPFNRGLETWAENHNFLYDGVDLEKRDRKIFGIRIQDVPQGHELRMLYPHKFR